MTDRQRRPRPAVSWLRLSVPAVEPMADIVKVRRISGGPRTISSGFQRVTRYEVVDASGGSRVVSLYQLDLLLDARAWPADFWVCVDAADLTFLAGDLDVFIEWPTGRRSDDRR